MRIKVFAVDYQDVGVRLFSSFVEEINIDSSKYQPATGCWFAKARSQTIHKQYGWLYSQSPNYGFLRRSRRHENVMWQSTVMVLYILPFLFSAPMLTVRTWPFFSIFLCYMLLLPKFALQISAAAPKGPTAVWLLARALPQERYSTYPCESYLSAITARNRQNRSISISHALLFTACEAEYIGHHIHAIPTSSGEVRARIGKLIDSGCPIDEALT